MSTQPIMSNKLIRSTRYERYEPTYDTHKGTYNDIIPHVLFNNGG